MTTGQMTAPKVPSPFSSQVNLNITLVVTIGVYHSAYLFQNSYRLTVAIALYLHNGYIVKSRLKRKWFVSDVTPQRSRLIPNVPKYTV